MPAIPSDQLHQLQQLFRDAILDGDQKATHADQILRQSRPGEPARIGIYRHAYRARLTEALRSNYPVLHRMLGDATFEELAQQYIHAYPSRHPSIRWFGETLIELVTAQPALLPHPALHDLIRMEWAICTAFDALETPAMEIADLTQRAASEWPILCFQLRPSVRILAMTWEIEPAWHQLNEDENADTHIPSQRPHHLLIWRDQFETHWRSLDALEAQLLLALQAHNNFSELCAIAADTPESAAQAAQQVAGLLRRWIEAGLLQRWSAPF